LKTLDFGRIVWARLRDRNGYSKLRPAVIVTRHEEIVAEGEVAVIAVTTKLPFPLPDDHVLLPWQRPRHPKTGLNERCAAVCGWLEFIRVEDVEEIGGIVPDAQLHAISRRLFGNVPPAS
jgi:hypothetical protein